MLTPSNSHHTAPIIVNALPFKMGSRVRSGLHVQGSASVHAVLDRTASGVIELWDLNTSTGTWVNGIRVDRCTLAHGDLITLAGHDYQLDLSPQGVCLHPINPWAWHESVSDPAPTTRVVLHSIERCLKSPRTAWYITLSAFAHWGVLLLAMTWPTRGDVHMWQEDSLPDVLITLAQQTPTAQPAQPPMTSALHTQSLIGDAHSEDFGTKRKGEEGAAGALLAAHAGETALPFTKAPSSARHTPSTAQPHRPDAPWRARKAGALSMLDELSISMNTHDQASEIALKMLDNSSAKGTGGLGLSGSGRGGAGEDERSIGIVLGRKDHATYTLGNQGMHKKVRQQGEAQELSIQQQGLCLSPASIKRVMDARARQIRTCYEDSAGPRRRQSGLLRVHIRTLRDGRVKRVKIQRDTLGMPDVRACVTSHIKTMRFAPTSGPCRPVSATRTYTFRPREEDAH